MTPDFAGAWMIGTLSAVILGLTSIPPAAGGTGPGVSPAQPRLPGGAPVERSTVHFRPTAGEARVPERFRMAAGTFEAELRPRARFPGVTISTVTFPSAVQTAYPENNTVYAEYFRPAGPGPFPGVVVLHILGGNFEISRMVASALARHGVAGLFIKLPYYGERRPKQGRVRLISEDLPRTTEGLVQAVLDVRRGVAWLAERSEIDARRLGLTGISMGGILGTLAAEAEPTLRRVCAVLAGGEIARNLWMRPEAARFRRKWEARGGTRESFARMWVPFDPVTYGSNLRGRRLLMIVGQEDDVIPPASATALWEAIGKPEIIWLPCGHYTAIGYIAPILERMTRFFGAWKPGEP